MEPQEEDTNPSCRRSNKALKTMTQTDLTTWLIQRSQNDRRYAAVAMVKSLQLLEGNIPDVLKSSLHVAEAFWLESSVAQADLDAERIRCCDYPDNENESANLHHPPCCAVRAVICALFPDLGSDVVGEVLDFFTQTLRTALSELDDAQFFDRVTTVVGQNEAGTDN